MEWRLSGVRSTNFACTSGKRPPDTNSMADTEEAPEGGPKARAGRRTTEAKHEIPDDIDQQHEVYRLFVLNVETARAAIGAVVSTLFRVRVTGLEHVPAEGGAILVCNHASYIDPVLLGLHFPRMVTFLAMSELFTLRERLNALYNEVGMITGMPFFWSLGKPLFEFASSLVGDGFKTQLLEWQAVPVVRNYRGESHRDAMAYYNDLMDQMKGLVNEGRIVAVFPEGGRTRTGELLEFKGMAASLSIDTGAPIIPSALVNTFGVLEPGNMLNGTSFVRDLAYNIGEPILPTEATRLLGKKQRVKSLTEIVRNRVDELLKAGVPETERES